MTRTPLAYHDCEAELKARTDYSPFRGTPAAHHCSCGNVYDYVDEESEGASWVLRPPAPSAAQTSVLRGYDEDKGPGQFVRDDSECSMCGDTGLMLGGWMGPTRDAPWPRACTSCDCGRAMTPRAVQLKVMELIERDLEQHHFTENDNGEPERVPGWWVAKYQSILDIGDPLGMMHDAEPFDTGDQDIASYVTDDDATVLVTRAGVDPPHSALATADIWKVIEPCGEVAVKKHRFERAYYYECGDAHPLGQKCTHMRGHAGLHHDDATGTSWS